MRAIVGLGAPLVLLVLVPECVQHGSRFELDPSALGGEEEPKPESKRAQPAQAQIDPDDDPPLAKRRRRPPPKDEPLPDFEVKRNEGAEWLKAIVPECELSMNGKPCDTPPTSATEEQRKECSTLCSAAVRSATERIVSTTLDECEKTALARPANAPFPACQFQFPPGADPRGDGKPVPPEKLSCVDACKEVVTTARNGAKERERANATGEKVVTAYKKCMLAVDSTLEARRYHAYDRELYDQLMGKTQARCRSANKCDWLEQHSDEWQCAYGNE